MRSRRVALRLLDLMLITLSLGTLVWALFLRSMEVAGTEEMLKFGSQVSIVLPREDGQMMNLSEEAGTVLVLFVGHCRQCYEEHIPYWNEIAGLAAQSQDPLIVLGVYVGSPDNLRQTRARVGIDFPLLLPEMTHMYDTLRELHVYELGQVYIIREGRILEAFKNIADASSRTALMEYVSGSRPPK